MADHEEPDQRRGRGRPKMSTEPLERVSTRIPTPQYDRLVKLANRQETSVSALIRNLLKLRLP